MCRPPASQQERREAELAKVKQQLKAKQGELADVKATLERAVAKEAAVERDIATRDRRLQVPPPQGCGSGALTQCGLPLSSRAFFYHWQRRETCTSVLPVLCAVCWIAGVRATCVNDLSISAIEPAGVCAHRRCSASAAHQRSPTRQSGTNGSTQSWSSWRRPGRRRHKPDSKWSGKLQISAPRLWTCRRWVQVSQRESSCGQSQVLNGNLFVKGMQKDLQQLCFVVKGTQARRDAHANMFFVCTTSCAGRSCHSAPCTLDCTRTFGSTQLHGTQMTDRKSSGPATPQSLGDQQAAIKAQEEAIAKCDAEQADLMARRDELQNRRKEFMRTEDDTKACVPAPLHFRTKP